MDAKGLKSLRISLASPEKIRSWSYGEVLKPETINYRRLRPEKDGLFCEAIFGPQRDWQCYCGKYKNIRYRGIVCDKCGVEVTRSSVRRERMGHISLAAPVAHVWYTRRVPSYMGLLLNISRRNLDRVLYFAQYVITYVDEDARQRALDGLEEEINSSEASFAAKLKEEMTAIKEHQEAHLIELDEKNKEIESRYDESLAKQLEPIIKEGQKLESKLHDDLGKTPRKEIKFNAKDTVVVKAGKEITNQHISDVQKLVQSYLEELENASKGDKHRELEHVTLNIASSKAETDLALSEIQNKLEEESTADRQEKIQMRDELLELQILNFMGENRYRELRSRWGQVFKADMGAEAFFDILRRLDLEKMAEELWHEVRTTRSRQKRRKATSRLKVVEAFVRSKNRPEWMILTTLPVIPPDLRPMVQLDGGRFATSDMNDLYRRVINRNNRLKRLLELGAPDVIVRNEKRMLQEAVDSLIDNSQRGKALSRRGRRELRSLSDLLKGKKGRFRRNLLGKRVDYSGRSVIVVGPRLKLNQCGLPKVMALELFRPFVISRLVAHKFAANVKGAKRFIERNRPEVWEVLEEVIKDRPVLLNRAPTLHRLGIQAFEPILVEGSAIHLHPLVTTAFNADFDGDMMAVHVPLSQKAVDEARRLMLSSQNLLKPADGEPIIGPSKDMVLGVYYLTMTDDIEHKGHGRVFANMDEVEMAYHLGQLEVHTRIKVNTSTWYDDTDSRLEESEIRLIDTTVGRVLFNLALSPDVQFVNRILDKGGVKDLIAELIHVADNKTASDIADAIKDIGFTYATRSGTTISISDINIPDEKAEYISEAMESAQNIERDHRRGLLGDDEKDRLTIEIWMDTVERVKEAVKKAMDPYGNMATMANSGASKGGFATISQLAGMRGMMADPSGRIIRHPIRSNLREGLSSLEYFISTHGSRKGLADTALRTADAGYLTRRLVDVAQDFMVVNEDCETEAGIMIRKSDNIADQGMGTRLFGRLTAERVVDPETGEVLVERNVMLGNNEIDKILDANIEEVLMRSPLTCQNKQGVCANCYGRDLGRGDIVSKGAAIGIIAAQSIGEPGTQLTLRTFHTGGVAAGSDITTGLPRVEELFEARRTPKGEAMVSEIGGRAEIYASDRYQDMMVVRVSHSEMINDEYEIVKGWQLQVQDATEIKAGDVIATHEDATITSENAGKVRIEGDKAIVAYEMVEEEEYEVPGNMRLIVQSGDLIEPGQQLTEGSLNPHSILRIQGREACQLYLLNEVQMVYRTQGQNIHDKHFELIIRKMMAKVQITHPGDTEMLPGDFVNWLELREINEELLSEGKQPAQYIEILLGITKASLNTDSFLSAASFQHTIKVLAGAAIAGQEDALYGLKENVILGKLIPAGTGYETYQREAEEALALEAAALAAAEVAEAAALAGEVADEELPVAADDGEVEAGGEDEEKSEAMPAD